MTEEEIRSMLKARWKTAESPRGVLAVLLRPAWNAARKRSVLLHNGMETGSLKRTGSTLC